MLNKYLLKATPTEIFMALYLKKHQPIIRLFLRFSGSLDKEVLERALTDSLKAAPLINAAYDFAHDRWAEKNYDGRDILSEVAAPDVSLEALTPYLLSGISFSTGPQMKVFLLRNDGGDSLCFVASHLAFDGLSLKRYAFMVANLYSSLQSGGEDTVTAGYSLDRSFRQVLKRLTAKQRRGLWVPPKIHKGEPIELPFSGMEKEDFVVTEQLEEDTFQNVIQKAKAAKATVNDVVMTAYSRALAKICDQSDIDLPCPTSFIKLLADPEKCAFSNLTGYYHLHIHIDAADDFAKSLSIVSPEMTLQKNSIDAEKPPFVLGLGFSVAPRFLAKKIAYRLAPPPTVSYTNIGIMEPSDLSFGDLIPEDAFFLTSVKTAPSFQLSVSTYDGILHLTSCFCGNSEDKSLIEKLLESIKDEMVIYSANPQ